MELTLDNVYKLLDSTEYTPDYLRSTKIQEPHFSLQEWTDTIKLLLDSLWPGYRIKNFERNEGFIRGGHHPQICNLPSHLESRVFKDVTIVSILGLYPTLISKLSNLEKVHNDLDPYDEEDWDDKSFFKEKLIWNVENFPILYDFLNKNRSEFNKFQNEKVDLLLRSLINYAWEIMNNQYSLFCCNNVNVVADTARKIMEYLHDTFQTHLIYQSPDSIYFSAYDEIKDKFETVLKDIDIKFRVDKHLYFIPFKKKKYILSDKEILNFTGFGEKICNLKEYYDRMTMNQEEDSEEKEYKFDSYNPFENNIKELSISMKKASQTIGLDLVENEDKTMKKYKAAHRLHEDETTFMPKMSLVEKYGNVNTGTVKDISESWLSNDVVGVKLDEKNVKPLPHNLDNDLKDSFIDI